MTHAPRLGALDNQAIDGCKRILDDMPSWMRGIVSASDTEERTNLARHIISELARFQETLVYFAGQDEYGTPTMTVGHITEVTDEELDVALRTYQERMGEYEDSSIRVGFLGARL